MRLLVSFIFAGMLAKHCPAQAPSQLDVCTVLEGPRPFSGTLIALRGIARSANGLTVGSDMCPKRLVLDKVAFRNEIAIEESAGNHVPFVTDEASFAELKAVFGKLNPATQFVSATFVGVFETRESLGDLVAGHGLTNGYGYNGRAPGQLILREVRDISVVTKPPAPQAHSLCEVLADPLSFDGRLVAVKGAIRLYQGLWLYEDQCRSHITIRGHSFENLIAVTGPTDLARLHDVQFDTDDQSVELVTNAFGESDAGHPAVFATLVGVFETRGGLNLVSQNGALQGFGHLGEAPAQLLLKECRDVTTDYVPVH